MSDRSTAAALALLDRLRPALDRRDRAAQASIIGQLIGLRAPIGDQWHAIANLALAIGEIGFAKTAIDLFVEARKGQPIARYIKASVLEQAGAMREAADVMATLPDDLPSPAAHAFSRGMAAFFLDEGDAARRLLERAVRLDPQSGSAWLTLATAVDLGADEDLAARIIAATPAMAAAPPAQLAPFLYAQGKAHADLGDHESAWRAFSTGASLMRRLAPYNRAAMRREAEEALAGYTSANIAALGQQHAELPSRTIFVTGLPRSGTTLVEQILVSHSAVSDGAEISRLPLLAQDLGGSWQAALARHVDRHGPASLPRLWQHLIGERFPGASQIVDKSLNTSRFLGIAASVLPDAPLVWMTRDPMDCAWSCFRTFFPVSMEWTFDLADIAERFRQEAQLLQRWQDLLGDRLLVVPYEELATESEGWIKRILAHCNLPLEAQPFSPHETRRTVLTASTRQVRKPINRAGIGSSAPYRRWLEPFAQDLGA